MPADPIHQNDTGPLVRVQSLTKTYNTGRGSVELFRDLSFTVRAGELLAIVGESGAGKSTLLHLLAALDKPTSGSVTVDGLALETLDAGGAGALPQRFHRAMSGRFHYLLPEFTAAENVAMPLLASRRRKSRSPAPRRTLAR